MKKSSHGGQTSKLVTIRYSAPNPLVNYVPGAEIKFVPDEKILDTPLILLDLLGW